MSRTQYEIGDTVQLLTNHLDRFQFNGRLGIVSGWELGPDGIRYDLWLGLNVDLTGIPERELRPPIDARYVLPQPHAT